jgi:hypothetical protein
MRRLAAAGLLTIGLLPLSLLAGSGPVITAAASDFCSRLGHSIDASAGAHMYCDMVTGVRQNPGNLKTQPRAGTHSPGCPYVPAPRRFGNNVDAADPHEDQNPACAQAYGQSEVSIAATGPYVVEAWNDSTAFFSPCGSPMYKEEGTGYGFSANRGDSFTDQGGLPNAQCPDGSRYQGDPAVDAWQSPAGGSYFYIASLFIFQQNQPPFNSRSSIAMDACQATGSGASATINCNPNPVIIANGAPGQFGSGDFLDKDYVAVDQARGRLMVSYTRFGSFSTTSLNGQIELAWCDLTANPLQPTCYPGASENPFLVVAPGDPNCENEGSYPAVHQASGDAYVAWEFNIPTNIFNPPCYSVPTTNNTAYVRSACFTPTPVSPCAGPQNVQSERIVSMTAAFIPGYNRFPYTDFPRIAVSDPFKTVTIVWNDARMHPTGDIYMQSYNLVSLSRVQASPVRVNSDSSYTWKVLPALRYPNSDGLLDISWFDRRREANPEQRDAYTDVYAALNVNPRMGSDEDQNGNGNMRVTNQASNWFAASSDIVPNFGDYTDINLVRTANGPTFTGNEIHVAWSDGRMGLPQPFTARFGRDGEQD